MIDKIQIAGFQSHKDTEISLSKGVNVIIGSSDSGKSSIIRGLKWLYQNRPQGDSFKNNELKPKDEVSVCTVFDNGEYISRERSSKVNQYATFEDIVHKALRSDVPPAVQDMTRMKEVNIQSQHPNDQYFLLTDSPGLVAKKFNEVSGLEIMDKAMLQINKQVREVNAKVKVIDSEIKNKKEQLSHLKWIPKATKEAKGLQILLNEIKQLKNVKLSLQDISAKLTQNKKDLSKYIALDKANKDVKGIKSTNDKILEISKKQKRLMGCIAYIKRSKQQINEYKGISQAQTSLKQHLKRQEQIDDKNQKIKKLKIILNKCIHMADVIKEAKTEVKFYEKKFKIKLKTSTCPVCGRK